LTVFVYSASHATRPAYQFLLSYDYRLLSYELLNLITYLLRGTFTAYAACAVSRDLSPGGKKCSTFLKSLTQIYLFALPLSGRRTKIKSRYWRKYPIVKATKFSAHARYHVTSA